MYLQGVDSVYDLAWTPDVTYGEVYHQNELEWSEFNFNVADVALHQRLFEDFEAQANAALAAGLVLPAYDFVLKCSHAFNMLDARSAISVTERVGYIARVRNLARKVAHAYLASREALGFPLLKQGQEVVP